MDENNINLSERIKKIPQRYINVLEKYFPERIANFLFIFPILLVVSLTVGFLTDVKREDFFYPLQIIITYIVFFLQYIAGYPVEVRDFIFLYYSSPSLPGGQMALRISGICTGIFEISFLIVLVMGMRDISIELRKKWAVILSFVVFIENIIRIFLLYPLTVYYGRALMVNFHDALWKFGQLAFIMIIYSIWTLYMEHRYLRNSIDA